MERSLADGELLDRLTPVHEELARRYPGESARRQPVHTVYGGAHLFSHDVAEKLGSQARRALSTYAPDADTFAGAVGIPGRLAGAVYQRVVDKLRREPVEDFRIDFEDGYGNRADAEEDHHTIAAAEAVADGMALGILPPFIGIRVKPLTVELAARGLRTLDGFLTTLVGRTGGALPDNFVVTLAKVAHPRQVAVLADALEALEERLGLLPGSVSVEIMIETPQAIIGPDGNIQVGRMVESARGRCVGAHFGTYDYTASCNITAAYQHMTHPACDFARHVLQVSLAGTGVWLSDGATNVLPVPPHRVDDGQLSDAHLNENRSVVHAAWRLHHEHIRHSLVHAYYQGWDLHPAQLPTRYAAVHSFFLEGVDAAAARLRNFVEQAARATLVGEVFDDAATGQGLVNFFLRGINSGAVGEDEAASLTGLTVDELHTRSFLEILRRRRG